MTGKRLNRPILSVIIPCYNEQEVLPELNRRLASALAKVGDYEIIFINDGSKDSTLQLLKEYSFQDSRIKVINFSRNFGHQIAITAGIDFASGDAVVVMDADLQDPPEFIPELVKKWHEGYDVVYAVREKREGEALFKKATAAGFYRLIRKLTNVDIPVDTGDFRLMSRRAVNQLKLLREKNRFVRGLVSWIGFRQTGITYERDKRFAGETKYPLKKMVKFAFDGITSFSFIPLQLATYLGFTVSLLSFFYAAYAVLVKVILGTPIEGWTSLMVALMFLGGVQLIMMGLIGEYIGRIYEEVKGRPLYLVEEAIGFDPIHDTLAQNQMAQQSEVAAACIETTKN